SRGLLRLVADAAEHGNADAYRMKPPHPPRRRVEAQEAHALLDIDPADLDRETAFRGDGGLLWRGPARATPPPRRGLPLARRDRSRFSDQVRSAPALCRPRGS